MTKQELISSEREKIKGNKLEYAYIAPQTLALYHILGSLVRAIGKGWTSTIIGGESLGETATKLRGMLKQPDQLYLQLEQSSSQAVFIGLNNTLFIKKLRDDRRVLGHSHVMTTDPTPDVNEYDLISNFKEVRLDANGITAITGTGKGKTTTALGMGIKSLVLGRKIAVVQWFKEYKSSPLTWAINEHNFPQHLKDPSLFEFYPTGAGFVGSPNTEVKHPWSFKHAGAVSGLDY